MHKQQLTNI